MDHGWRTLAVLLLVACNTARVCPPWAEASGPLQDRGVQTGSALWCWTLLSPGEDQPPWASTALNLSASTLGVFVEVYSDNGSKELTQCMKH